MDLTGFGVEPQEIDLILDSFVGEPDPGEDPHAWYLHLSSRQALLEQVVKRLAVMREDSVYAMYQAMDGGSYAKLAERLGTSRALVQQKVEKGRARADA